MVIAYVQPEVGHRLNELCRLRVGEGKTVPASQNASLSKKAQMEVFFPTFMVLTVTARELLFCHSVDHLWVSVGDTLPDYHISISATCFL